MSGRREARQLRIIRKARQGLKALGFEVDDLSDLEVEAAVTLLKALVTDPLNAAEKRRRLKQLRRLK